MDDTTKVIIIPCSGIGKTYGTVSREAAYEVIDVICPQTSTLVPLSKLVLGDEEAKTAIAENRVITIDGCALACATKMVEESGGSVNHQFAVLDAYRRHRQMKPRGISELNEGGLQLAHALATEIAAAVDELQGEENA
jgi:uncharacterized metal-binding protein